MGVFGAFFACIGVAGFKGCWLGASLGDGGFTLACISGCRGVVGFTVTTSVRPVREKVLPAWPDGGREREKVRPVRSQWLKIGVFGRAGRVFSRKSRWRGCAGRVFSRTGSRGIPPGEHCRAAALAAGPSTGSVNPSMRSYTHLAEAGHGRPTRPQQPTPQRKALTKGKRLLVKAVTSLDNGRKWRVCAGHTLELLR